jgi:hypothetical protein
MSCDCGLWPLTAGGWAEPACKVHDEEYELMKAGLQTKTLDQVDYEFLFNLLNLSHRGLFQSGKIAASYTMYGLAHAYGLVFWKGLR